MKKIRVLVVDDAVVVRRILTDVLSGDPEIEIAGIAANGQIALATLPQVNPDLVTLDMEMPVMGGLETLRALRKTHAKLPVIMFSTLTERGAAATLDALSAGANDYVTKPANVGSVSIAMDRIREELIPKIKALCAVFQQAAARRSLPSALSATPYKPFPRPATAGARIEIVGIGASTGGPNALADVIPKLPRNLQVPVVITQHMPPIFTKLLAERLASHWGGPVKEAQVDDRLEPGHIFIAPGNYHMVLERRADGVYINLNQNPTENSCRPAVDVMLRSVASVYGCKSLAVILTGMGRDGFHGCTAVRDAGGRVLAQDEATSVVWGMPGFVARGGLAEKILPLPQIATEIQRFVSGNRLSTVACAPAA